MSKSGDTLIFVYNADSGLLNAVKDALHKAVSPGTYLCKLFALTYGAVNMKSNWRRFVEGLGVPVVFLHKDELRAEHTVDDAEFSSAYMKVGDELRLIKSRSEMNNTGNLEELMELVRRRLDVTAQLKTEL